MFGTLLQMREFAVGIQPANWMQLMRRFPCLLCCSTCFVSFDLCIVAECLTFKTMLVLVNNIEQCVFPTTQDLTNFWG